MFGFKSKKDKLEDKTNDISSLNITIVEKAEVNGQPRIALTIEDSNKNQRVVYLRDLTNFPSNNYSSK